MQTSCTNDNAQILQIRHILFFPGICRPTTTAFALSALKVGLGQTLSLGPNDTHPRCLQFSPSHAAQCSSSSALLKGDVGAPTAAPHIYQSGHHLLLPSSSSEWLRVSGLDRNASCSSRLHAVAPWGVPLALPTQPWRGINGLKGMEQGRNNLNGNFKAINLNC